MASTRARSPKGRAHHRRDPAAQLAVLRAADDLLVERGFRGVTVEGIAARAGVAKQTIYRWWPSKADILLDGLVEDARELMSIPSRGAVLSRAKRHFQAVATFVAQDDAGKVLLALIGEAQSDEQLARALSERYLEPLREQERALLSEGVASGELPARLEVDAVLDAITGPIIYRALLGARVPRTFVDGLVTRSLAES